MPASEHREVPVALIVVDHGSRSETSNASLDEVVRDVAARSAGRFVAVLGAHMEIARPTLTDAFEAAVAAGAARIVVAPYFLAPGRHSESDVPRLAAEAASRHPGVEIRVAACLGPDPALTTLVLERAGSAMAKR